MRAIALLTMVALAAVAATPADAAKKKAKAPAVDPKMATNAQSAALVRDSLPLWLPTAAKLVYYNMPENKEPKAGKKKRAAR